MGWLIIIVVICCVGLGIRHPWKWFTESGMRGQRRVEDGTVGTNVSQQSQNLGLRLFLAAGVLYVFVGVVSAALKELATTNDFVLEYRYWLFGSTYLIAVALAVLVFVISRPNPETPKRPPDTKAP